MPLPEGEILPHDRVDIKGFNSDPGSNGLLPIHSQSHIRIKVGDGVDCPLIQLLLTEPLYSRLIICSTR
jgi:hypothetical protein